jgi:sialic acid synthase SpsE
MEIIAEIGQNHNGDINYVQELIHAAKENGADSVKFQLYDAKKLFPKEGNEWYDYNCKTEISRDWLYLLSEECKKVKIELMASVFDIDRISWLEEVKVRRYKIASRSIYDTRLIQALANTGKPIIASLGMWKEHEFPKIETSASVLYLYCVSKYPVPLTDLNLSQVDFTKYAGFSDHTVGIAASIAAYSLGARIIEKHFTLDKSMYGPDHACSMTPDELKQLHDYCLEIKQSL